MDDYAKAPMTVTNENWKGKNDPAERRRIQNRINQRAYRQRQREGESPKAYRARLSSSDDSVSPQCEDRDDCLNSHENSTSASPASYPSSPASAGRQVDELARLINRNFQAAAASNARALGVSPLAIQQPELGVTPRPHKTLAAGLHPIAAQHQVPHDLVFDVIPHPRLRYNILAAIKTARIDGAALGNDLRVSGALEQVHGSWQRCGLVVWGAPDEMQSWEISVGFLRRWGFLLQGCEDLLAVTNAWRAQRGEATFSLAGHVS